MQAKSSYPMFADVIGCEEAKEKLGQYMAVLRDPAGWRTLQKEWSKSSAMSIAFVDSRGSGKRMLALAAANEANAKWMEMDLHSNLLVDGFQQTFQTMRRLIVDTLEDGAPSILFVRHDHQSAKRSQQAWQLNVTRAARSDQVSEKMQEQQQAEQDRLLLELLREYGKVVDALPLSPPVLLVVSTNQGTPTMLPDMEEARFVYPDKATRNKLFRARLESLNLAAQDEWFEKLADNSLGLNGQDISHIFQRAVLVAHGKNKTIVDQEDVEESLE